MNELHKFTTAELLEEIARRETHRQERKPIKHWCDDCRNFVAWRKPGDPPDDYNPCGKGHTMSFRMPTGYGDMYETGFYRLVCADRLPPES